MRSEHFERLLEETGDLLGKSILGDPALPSRLTIEEVGRVTFVGRGFCLVDGLPTVAAEEVLRFREGRLGMAWNLDPDRVGVVLLDQPGQLAAGQTVERTGRVLDVPVGGALLGRTIDPVGRPRDGGGPVEAEDRLPVERPAPGIMQRAPVTVPLQTGMKVVDALVPIGRGQRQLILGDRQTGKTALAVAAILNQHDQGVLCVYCAIGQRNSAIATVIADLRSRGSLDYTAVVATSEDDPPGLQFVAPYAAMSVAEHFMHHGRDVLVVLDDLTRHARAYRELSLLLRRPPGREAFPGDVFYIHSRLLERATHLADHLGGGSVTALPIVQTEAQNLSAYIPTNLISITDGQVYLSPDLFAAGMLPAVDVGRSVSRVGGKAQLPAYRVVAGDLRLSYSQFAELEAFARFGTRLDPATKAQLERGYHVRAVLRQGEFDRLPPATQVAVLLAVNAGLLDQQPLEAIPRLEEAIRHHLETHGQALAKGIESAEKLTAEDRANLEKLAREAIEFATP